GDHGHGVGGELAGTGAERRQAYALELGELALLHVAREHGAHALIRVEHGDVPPAPAARKRRAAVDEYRRHIEPHHRHHHARERLVAAGEADERIVSMAAYHGLDAVGDDL